MVVARVHPPPRQQRGLLSFDDSNNDVMVKTTLDLYPVKFHGLMCNRCIHYTVMPCSHARSFDSITNTKRNKNVGTSPAERARRVKPAPTDT